MRKLVVLALAVALTPVAGAKVWTTVYRCDETTPLAAVDPNRPAVYRDIMVGTRLVFVVSSDTGGYWQGGLRLSWDDAEYATVSGRGYIAPTPGAPVKLPNYAGSCLDAAGTQANARPFQDIRGIGFELRTTITGSRTGVQPTVPGDWFILDYRAEQVGSCEVGLYNLSVSYDVPIDTLAFTHVPSRDFNGDALVDFKDFALLASHQGGPVNKDPNDPDSAFDLNGDAKVDLGDFALFSEYWLERADCTQPGADPSNLPAGKP
jgi:hypothetical protein